MMAWGLDNGGLPFGIAAPIAPPVSAPLRLSIDLGSLVANWRWFAARSAPAACGAAVKADGYGLGAKAIVSALAEAGCRVFFVASWDEARALLPLADGLTLKVLHGVLPADMPVALHTRAIPILNTPIQVVRWREAAPDKPCDVMVDTGMNRLGLSVAEASGGLTTGLALDTLHSHLARADEPGSGASERQRAAFLSVPTTARRAIANSAGICLGADYHFDLTRPGLGLYGGIPHPAASRHIAQVATPQAQLVQRRDIAAGESVGYGATFTATRQTRVAVLNLGYADGYLRAFSAGRGHAEVDGVRCPVLGRVSMDLTAVDVTDAPPVSEGDWIDIGYDLAAESAATGLTQYELLTGLGPRYQRRYA